MLGMGAATYVKELWKHFKRPWGCLIGLFCQFIVLPAVGFSLCLSLDLSPYQALGVLILTCSPGGAFSNFFTFWVDGDLALSIMMTAVSALVAFVAMPFNLWVYTHQWTSETLKVPYTNILASLALVAFPSILGMFIRYKSKKWGDIIKKGCGILGWILVVACAAMLLSIYWKVLLNADLRLLAAAALLPGGGCLIAYIVARIICFSHKISRTIGIETGCQNMPVATNIMLLSFPNTAVRVQLVTFPLLYAICQLSMIFVFIGLFHLYRYWQGGSSGEDEAEVILRKLNEATQDPSISTDPTTPVSPTFRTSIPLPDHLSPENYRKSYPDHPEDDSLMCNDTDNGNQGDIRD
ncbi:ileal sodium/bile acid cotransporter-like isoform X2 [Penaeus japonicus]|nr:ileal sodium/bile acid cotransporter-like isoform X2 [Penaeus japonicus]